MSASYGSNRSIYIAVGELLPTFIELGLLLRPKRSVYYRNPAKEILNSAVAELLVYTDIKLSKSTPILVDDVSFRPWFAWFYVSRPETLPFTFIKFADGIIGKGYLGLK
jgi:hypothetical protein